jgi:hypothetical protein
MPAHHIPPNRPSIAGLISSRQGCSTPLANAMRPRYVSVRVRRRGQLFLLFLTSPIILDLSHHPRLPTRTWTTPTSHFFSYSPSYLSSQLHLNLPSSPHSSHITLRPPWILLTKNQTTACRARLRATTCPTTALVSSANLSPSALHPC